MREKFALVEQSFDETEDEYYTYVYETIVNVGLGPTKLRLTLSIDGCELDPDTLEARAHGPASWLWEKIGLRSGSYGPASLHRGSGETGGMPVNLDDAWEILTAAGLPADYSFV